MRASTAGSAPALGGPVCEALCQCRLPALERLSVELPVLRNALRGARCAERLEADVVEGDEGAVVQRRRNAVHNRMDVKHLYLCTHSNKDTDHDWMGATHLRPGMVMRQGHHLHRARPCSGWSKHKASEHGVQGEGGERGRTSSSLSFVRIGGRTPSALGSVLSTSCSMR